MKMSEIHNSFIIEMDYSLDDLDKQFHFDFEKTAFGKKLVPSSDIFERAVKKITAATFFSIMFGTFGAFGFVATDAVRGGNDFTLGASATLGFYIGLALGVFGFGKKKPESPPTGIKKLHSEHTVLEQFHDNFISTNAINKLGLDELDTKIAIDREDLKHGSDKKTMLLLSELPEIKKITKHLYSASKEISNIAAQYQVTPKDVASLYQYLNGASPMENFFENLKHIST